MPAHRKVTDEQLTEAYARTQNVWAVGRELGICGQSAHERLTKLGVINERNLFTKADEARLILEYEFYASRGKLEELALSMGRTKPFIAREAGRLGLTDQKRKRPFVVWSVDWSAQPNGHPRGMKGKRHTREARARMSASHFKRMVKQTPAERMAYANSGRRSWKAGWRVVGGKRIFFRSRWEANYARYLEWLRERGEIKSWSHEPKTFWFLKIKRGRRSYLPDFLVVENNGSEAYHEVKGWMDADSKTKLNRMAKYYPEVRVIIIDSASYKSIASKISRLISGWETSTTVFPAIPVTEKLGVASGRDSL